MLDKKYCNKLCGIMIKNTMIVGPSADVGGLEVLNNFD